MTEPRRAEPGDVPGIARLVERAYEGYVPRVGRRPSPMDADYERIVADGRAWVIEEDGAIAGVLVVEEQPDHLLVENVAVEPERQRGGLGGVLLSLAERLAADAGLHELRLYTHSTMSENLAMYPRLGYDADTDRTRGDPYGRVHFRKRLP